MKNDLFTIGPVTFHSYGLMIAIGVIAAYITAEYRAKRKGMNHELVFDLTFWCLIGGILGAKLLYYITQLKVILADPSLLLDVRRGFVVYGGIIGGIFSGYLFTRKHKLNFLQYFDLVMPSIALAQGFGRLGCLLAGCCYGAETTSPFHLVFHDSDFAPNGVPLIPTQPISSALDFLNFFALITIAKRSKANGQVAGFYLTFYSVGRFLLEFFRGDIERGEVGPLSTSQFISIFTFLIGIAIIILCGKHSRRTAQNSEDIEEDLLEEAKDSRLTEENKDGEMLAEDKDNELTEKDQDEDLLDEDIIIELLEDEEKE
jgi:phosphatidylglycerol:prolipoprotein diacylglycerol transferase